MSRGTIQRERRWVILVDDGSHVTVGRHSDPFDDEVARAALAIGQIGAGGWLAVMEGVYYGRGAVSLMMVRELAPPRRNWDEAVAAFGEIRTRANLPPLA